MPTRPMAVGRLATPLPRRTAVRMLLLMAAGRQSDAAPASLTITPPYADVRGGATVQLTRSTPFESPVSAEVHCGFGASTWVPGVLRDGGRSITCTVPPSPGHTLGSTPVYVRIDPLAELQGEASLVYFDAGKMPIVSAVRPDTSDDVRSTPLRVLGTNFAPLVPSAMLCAFGPDGPTAATFISPTELACASPVSSDGASHTVELRVSVDGRRFSHPGEAQFHLVNAHAIPHLSHIAPNLGPVSGGVVLTLSGSGFAPAPGRLQCTFGGGNSHQRLLPTAATFDSSEQVRCVVPSAPTSSVVAVPVALVAAGGSPRSSTALPFVYHDPSSVPTVSAVEPAYGDVHTPPSVVLTGTGFAPVGDHLTCQIGRQWVVSARTLHTPR